MTKQLKEDLSQAHFMVSFISLLSNESKGYEQAAEQKMNEVSKQSGLLRFILLEAKMALV